MPAFTEVLVVEGPDDFHLVANLCVARGLPGHPKLVDLEGYGRDKLRDVIRAQLETAMRVVAVIVDADSNPTGRWTEIAAAAGVDLTADLSGGLVHDFREDKRFAAWVWPDNLSPGVMEDFFCGALIPARDPALEHADRVIHELPGEVRRFRDVHRPKARMRTWLAWQEPPGATPGLALKYRLVAGTDPRVDRFADWVSRAVAP